MGDNFLDNVKIVYIHGNRVAVGQIYNDAKCRFKGGTTITKSEILFIDEENRTITTLNTVYNY